MSVSPLAVYYQHAWQCFALTFELTALLYNKHASHYSILIVTGFRKTDHIVTIDIARNTDLKY